MNPLETDALAKRKGWFHGPLFVAAGMLVMAPLSLGQNAHALNGPPECRSDQNVELALKVDSPFTLVAVGDMLQMVPFAKRTDPDIQAILNIMRGADITIANAENLVLDMDNYFGPTSHLQAPKEVADDWAAMGIKMVTRANNETFEHGEVGLRENLRQIERVGIIHVGVGHNMTEARLARYAGTAKGTVGMVGIYAQSARLIENSFNGTVVTVTPAQLAQLRAMRDAILARGKEVRYPFNPRPDPDGQVSIFALKFVLRSKPPTESDESDIRVPSPPRSMEQNTLRVTTYNGVTAEQMAQLRAIANDTGGGDTLSAWGVNFKIMPGPGEYYYEMNPQDERDILREVRTGKQFSDFELVMIHWHQDRFAYQAFSMDNYPPEFEIKFAHEAIDQGADAFVSHGVHTIRGVEIYKGKPIFYGVASFVRQTHIFPFWRDAEYGGKLPPSPMTGPIIGMAEQRKLWLGNGKNLGFEALMASIECANGQLATVRIYPVDCGPDRPDSQLGIPKRPSAEVAARILGDVVEYSKPFGTQIAIENGVGVIHVAPKDPGAN